MSPRVFSRTLIFASVLLLDMLGTAPVSAASAGSEALIARGVAPSALLGSDAAGRAMVCGTAAPGEVTGPRLRGVSPPS